MRTRYPISMSRFRCVRLEPFTFLHTHHQCYQDLLLSGKAENRDRARDVLASVLTRGRGEYIFRIGSFPPHASLFAYEPITANDAHGTPRTAQELCSLHEGITNIVDEVGGKVGFTILLAHFFSDRIFRYQYYMSRQLPLCELLCF